MIDFFKPASIQQAIEILAQVPGATCLAGGTDLVVGLRAGALHPDAVVDLGGLGLDAIDILADEVRIGATVTMSRLAELSDTVPQLGLLAEAASTVGAWQIQNRATIGGNICNASPAADAVCALLALDAEVEITAAAGARRMALEKFLKGPGKTSLQNGEILSAVFVPGSEDTNPVYASYRKQGTRNAMVIALASLAGFTQIRGGRVRRCSLALGSVAPTCIRARSAESFLLGKELTNDVVVQAVELARSDASPIDDARASASYRSDLVAALVTEHLLAAREALHDESTRGAAS